MDWMTLMQLFGGGAQAGGLAGALGGAGAAGAAGAASTMPVAAAAPMAAEALPAMAMQAPMAGGSPMVNPALDPSVAFAPPPAPALGSGQFGIDSVVPGVMGMGPNGPMGQGPVAQGTGPLLAQGIPTDDSTLSKLAKAPIDPKLLLQMLEQGQGGKQTTQTRGGGGGGGGGVGQMTKLGMGQVGPRATLSQLLGR